VSAGLVVVSALIASVIGEHTVAAILAPVCLAMVRLEGGRSKNSGAVAKLLLFSVAYGCMMGSPGTPSGGARNAIILEYWSRLYQIKVDYWSWVVRAYPMVLIQIPLLILCLWMFFRPGKASLSRVFVELRREVRQEGRMTAREWTAIGLFALVLLLWVTRSETWGLGGIAIFGASLYLIMGLISWPDMSRGVNWGVVLIYGSTISVGIAMTKTGAAAWLAEAFLASFEPLGIREGPLLYAPAALLTAAITSIQSGGSAVSVIGPVVLQMAKLGGASLVGMGLVCGISSAFAYLTVLGSPASIIVYSTGLLRPTDFIRVGWRAMVASFFALAIIAAFYWPLAGV
jgi:sodium-dependent dicarboxylate transporter 2/3/5